MPRMRPAATTTSNLMTNQASEIGRPCCLKNASVAGMPRYPTLNHQWAIQKPAKNEAQQSRADGARRPQVGKLFHVSVPRLSDVRKGVFAGAVLFSDALAMICKLGSGTARRRPPSVRILLPCR
jgi:hypothetical protein